MAVFPADTVYGLACDPQPAAVGGCTASRAGRPDKPSAVMFFDGWPGRPLPELGRATRAALERLLPGAVTVLLPNPGAASRWPAAPIPATLGLRVPDVPALAGVGVAVLQSSANLAGGQEARRLEDVPRAIRAQADLVLDGGELPGTPSTVIDLRAYEADRAWSSCARVLSGGAVAAALDADRRAGPIALRDR